MVFRCERKVKGGGCGDRVKLYVWKAFNEFMPKDGGFVSFKFGRNGDLILYLKQIRRLVIRSLDLGF